MDRARIAVVAALAAAGLTVAACGSAASSGNAGAPPSPTTSPKLVLAASAQSAATAALAPAPDVAGPAILPASLGRFELGAALPDLGATAVVRQMRAHAVSATDVRRFAAALGLSGNPVQNADGWSVQDPHATLSFFDSDGDVRVTYSAGGPGVIAGSGSAGSAGSGSGSTTSVVPPVGVVDPGGPMKPAPASPPASIPSPAPAPSPPVPSIIALAPTPVDLPSAAAAEQTARALLDRLGVLTGQTWSTAVEDSGVLAIACAPGQLCPNMGSQTSARTVTFSLLIGGARVNGIDWSVTLGEHSVVESLSGEWATPDPIGTYPLRSTAAVFADLQHGTARPAIPLMLPLAGRVAGGPTVASPPATAPMLIVRITGVTLGLTRWDAIEHGHAVVDLVPTYRFHAQMNGGTTEDIEVIALAPAAATFTAPGPKAVPMPGEVVPATSGAGTVPVGPDTPAP